MYGERWKACLLSAGSEFCRCAATVLSQPFSEWRNLLHCNLHNLQSPYVPVLRAVCCAGTSNKQLKLEISQKEGLGLALQGPELFSVEGVLTTAEAAKLAAAAEALGFQAQGSRGASHGEVSKVLNNSL